METVKAQKELPIVYSVNYDESICIFLCSIIFCDCAVLCKMIHADVCVGLKGKGGCVLL